MNEFLTLQEKVAAAASLNIPQRMNAGALAPDDIMAFGDKIAIAVLHKVLAGYNYHPDGSSPAADQIFVFGSNLAGIHGAGAARAALDLYGAIFGIGEGLCGRSYAIPTKDQRVETLPIHIVRNHVAKFKQYAIDNPDMKFFVTRVGCGLAGYVDANIAPMFCGSPLNCEFPEQWRQYLEPEHRAKSLAAAPSVDAAWVNAARAELIRLSTAAGLAAIQE